MFLVKFLKKVLALFGCEIRRTRNIAIPSYLRYSKYEYALSFWVHKYNQGNHTFGNGHFKKIMLGMAQEVNDAFLQDKIVVDFGCGPRGSLVWTDAPKLKIGVDVLVDEYIDHFFDEMVKHNYLYIKSTEKRIPIPNEFADIVYTMNAIDHVDNFEIMLNELLRILKTGGEFIGSFNMNEPASKTEPQTLTFEMVENAFSNRLEIIHKITAYKRDSKNKGGTYGCFFERNSKQPSENDECILWIRGKKIA